MKQAFMLRHLTLAVIGTMTSMVALANTNEPTVELGHEVINLDRQGTKVKTNVVTLQEKDESTATDLRGLLQGEPAIDFSGGNGTSQYLTIRGMGQNSIDVKVDNAYSDSQILYHQGRHMLDPSLVKIVSVQKGAGSASAGIGATNGAIVAKTIDAYDLLKNTDKDWGVKVNAGYSSNDETSYGVTGFGKAGNFDFLVSYNEVDQKNYKAGSKSAQITSNAPAAEYVSPYDGSKKVAYSALDKESYLIKAGYNLGDHRFVASHFNTTNKGERYVREEFDFFAGNEARYRELSLENTNLEYIGNNLGFADKVEANVYQMKNKRKSSDDSNNGYAGRTANENTTVVKTTGANLNLDNYLTDGTLFKYGVNYRKQEIEPHTASNGVFNQTDKTDTGVYTEIINDIGKFTLTGGMRYDHFSYNAIGGKKISDGTLSPSVGIIWQALPSLSLNVTHNHATRSPRLVDALRVGVLNTSIADGTKAEKAKNTEIGFNFNHGNFSADGSYFWQEIDNLLQAGQITRHDETGSTEIVAGISNVGYGKNHGFEINTRYRYKGLTARLGVAESNPEYHSTTDARGNPVAFSNREFGNTIGRTWTAGLAYRFDNPNLEVGVNHRKVEDVTGQSAWQYHRVTGNSRGFNDLELIKYGYNVTDVYANWKPYGNDKMNVNFSVNNITDEYYRSHTAISGLPGVGREYRVGVNFTY
ncbi:MAG: TonB-dependent receptor [Moraxella sp.]|uniref:TonB-dependent receptor domain-containing protein n=1 Tax=Moraxella sp. TaxID=479 RepID=UPI0026DB4FA2|nr:TonB-dependent receptor [Moraxella sp.]MDO4451164.1 TonB-dependent receptor [Moraxella sp.]